MAEVPVAVLGAMGWMGKVHTMAYQTFLHFLGISGGTARVVALVANHPNAEADLGFRAQGAKILRDWRDADQDPDIDVIHICLPDRLNFTTGIPAWQAFAAGHHFCQIVDACMDRSRLGRWVDIA